MSKKLLYHINGDKEGKFKRWLDHFDGEPRVAWYPSAGTDFRDILYCSEEYKQFNPVEEEPSAPDLFIHTDYFPWTTSTFLDSKELYKDQKSTITLLSLEELPEMALPLSEEVVDFPNGSNATGKVLFLEIEINSTVLGCFTKPLLYIFSENGAFCAEKLLPFHASLSHIIRVRYGGGLGGGGKSRGAWLYNVLERLECELYITDRYSFDKEFNTDVSCEQYPVLKGEGSSPSLTTIRTLSGEKWSDYGDVQWLLVNKDG